MATDQETMIHIMSAARTPICLRWMPGDRFSHEEDLDITDRMCPECLKLMKPPGNPPPGFVWNPEYFTASHQIDFTGCVHPDVFIKLPAIDPSLCRIPSGTYTAPQRSPGHDKNRETQPETQN